MVEQKNKYSNVFSFTSDDIDTYVKILAQSFHTKQLSFNEFKEAMKDVMLVDRDGMLWTIGAGSGAWYRREEEHWIKSVPPTELFSAYNVIKGMKAGTWACPSCHSRVPDNFHFCPQCGKPRQSDTPGQTPEKPAAEKPVFCRKCGKPLQPEARFCTSCGTPRRP